MKQSIHYFEDVRGDNTGTVFTLIRERARKGGIKKLVLASTTGSVAARALAFFKDDPIELIVVPHQYDFMAKDSSRFPQELAHELRTRGHKVHFGTMLFHTDKLYGNSTPAVVADFLRTFGEGTKVCVEMTLMAADAGLVSQSDMVIVAAGTGRGLDTALVVHPGSSQSLNMLKISEVLCKPLNRRGDAGGTTDETPSPQESTLDSIFTRRSVRDFDRRPLTDDIKKILLEAAAAAPSAHGKSPWKFAELSDPERIGRIVRKIPWFAPAAKSAVNILVMGEPSKCVNREYWVVDCAAATQNILLAARSLGLGSVWMGIAPVEENIRNFTSIVPLPEGIIPFSLIAIGYPEAGKEPVRREVSAEKFIITI